MKRKSPILDEPGVAEVRAWRDKLWKQGGQSISGVFQLLDARAAARQKQTPSDVAVKPAATTKRPPKRSTASRSSRNRAA